MWSCLLRGLWHDAVMDQGVAAALAALIAIVGVGVGLIGAHWQSRGALRHVDATVQAALKQADAAVEAVRAQAKEQNAHWRRTTQREAWVGFLRIVDSCQVAQRELFEAQAFRQHSQELAALQSLRESFDEARRSYYQMEIESPDEVVQIAGDLLAALQDLYSATSHSVHHASGLRMLHSMRESELAGPSHDGHACSVLSTLQAISALSGEPLTADLNSRLRSELTAVTSLSNDERVALSSHHVRIRAGSRDVDGLTTIQNDPYMRIRRLRDSFVWTARLLLDGHEGPIPPPRPAFSPPPPLPDWLRGSQPDAPSGAAP